MAHIGALLGFYYFVAVAVQVNDVPADYYVVEVARLANARVLRVADLTSRFRLHHLPHFVSPPFDMLFTPSHFVARHAAVLAENIATFVTPGAVDTSAFDPDVVTPLPFCRRDMWNVAPMSVDGRAPSLQPVFGFIARLSEEKGPGLFLAAAHLVVQSLPGALFFMVGKPPGEKYLKGLLTMREALNLTEHVSVARVCVLAIPRACGCTPA